MKTIIEQIREHLLKQSEGKRWVPVMVTTSLGTFHGFIITSVDDQCLYGMDQQQRVDFALDLNTDNRTIWRIPLTDVKVLNNPSYN